MPDVKKSNYRVEVIDRRGRIWRQSESSQAADLVGELNGLFKGHSDTAAVEARLNWDAETVCTLCKKPYELEEDGTCAWCGEVEEATDA